MERKYNGDASKVPTISYLAPQAKSVPVDIPGVLCTKSTGSVTYQVTSTNVDASAWLETLAGSDLNWLRALVTSATIVQGTSYINNPIRRLLAPRVGQKVVIKHTNSLPSSVTVYGAARSYGEHQPSFKAVEIVYAAKTNTIDLTMFEERGGSSVPLSLQFQYTPTQGYAPIHEVSTGRNQRIKQFYWKLWYGDKETLPKIDIKDKFVGPEVTISAEDVEQFCLVVGNQSESFKSVRSQTVQAPMDFAIVTGWQVCV